MWRPSRLGLLVTADPSRRSILLGPEATVMRRELGPTSWVVLEEMLARSTDVGECCTATVSIRTLGASLGLAKDTVARAIRRLQAAAIVTAAPSRTPAETVDTGSYSITVPCAVRFEQTHTVKPVDGVAHTFSHTPVAPPRGRIARLDPAQLSLAAWD